LRRAHSKPGEQQPSRRCRKQDVAAGAAAVIDVLIATLLRTQRKHHYKGQRNRKTDAKTLLGFWGPNPNRGVKRGVRKYSQTISAGF